MTRLQTAIGAYFEAFKLMAPMPFGVSDDWLAEVLEKAILEGQPVPENFDWWPDLPPDATA